ncbi:amidase [Thalassobaculum sp. OXR-137]|uniref:amidase n=1 Tax=Thalassobaculum sp. OXR-137 TaxID=3100173 RepID=UPI002AC8EECA|nr:amidase [Thalassobaculum sp. OXR-137]WPZ32944.1 amidase [Thalassobaculum sp. OXR-137]
MADGIGAFVPGTDIRVEGAAEGPLKGLTFAAKDLFDVAGHPTGGGNHDWPTGRAVPTRNAWAVQRLLDGGATLVGKTITDEVSLGILGESAFDGTPVNVNAPGRVPGGSSSGSAAAVAAGLCDTALGTDTGGSVRVPSSFCGLYGIRPTHGRLPVDGMMPQAPTSDTTGWFARDAETFAKVSGHLLGEAIPSGLPNRLLVTTDTFAFAEDAVAEALAPLVDRLARLIGAREDVLLAPQGLSVWARAQRTIQPREAYETFKPWLDTNPRMAFGVARGLMQGAAVTETELGWANQMRREARGRLKSLLPAGTILCLPTTPFPAPPTGLTISQQTPLREQITCLCAFGGLAGRPQVSIPGAKVDGLPIGLSIVGGAGTDATLIAVARALETAE